MANHIIRDPERYFNRYIACEIKNDRRKAAEIRETECSLDEKLEADKHPDDLIGNLHGELLDSAVDFPDNIEDERLYTALKALSPEQLRLVRMVCEECLTQREIAVILGISQKTVCMRLQAVYGLIRNYFAKSSS